MSEVSKIAEVEGGAYRGRVTQPQGWRVQGRGRDEEGEGRVGGGSGEGSGGGCYTSFTL